ncbi:unnamed protein product [Victoria cruziana]
MSTNRQKPKTRHCLRAWVFWRLPPSVQPAFPANQQQFQCSSFGEGSYSRQGLSNGAYNFINPQFHPTGSLLPVTISGQFFQFGFLPSIQAEGVSASPVLAAVELCERVIPD